MAVTATQRQGALDAWTALCIARALGITLTPRHRFVLEQQACLMPLERIGELMPPYPPYSRERVRQVANDAKMHVRLNSRDTSVGFYHRERFGP